MFGVILLLAEFVPGGGIVGSFSYRGLNLLRYHNNGAGMVVLITELTFIVFAVFFTRREYKTFKKEGRSYFASPWTYLEITVIFLSFVAIVLYLVKTAYTYWLLDLLTESKGRKNIRMQSLASFDKMLTQIIAFILFTATIKLLKLLRFNKRIGYLSATLKLAGPEIIAFFFILLLTVFSFVTVFYLLARTTSQDYSTFLKAIEASFFIIDQKFEDIRDGNKLVGPMMYFCFAFIMYFVVFPFLIAIVCSAFSTIKRDLSAQPNDYEVVEYMMSVVAALWRRFRPKVGPRAAEKDDVAKDLDDINRKLNKALKILKDRSKGK